MIVYIYQVKEILEKMDGYWTLLQEKDKDNSKTTKEQKHQNMKDEEIRDTLNKITKSNKNERENLVSEIDGMNHENFLELLIEVEKKRNGSYYIIFLTTAPRLIPKIVLLRLMSEKFPSGKKEWIERIEIFTSRLSNEDGKILSSTIADLPEEELKNLLENIIKYDDNLNLLQIMASNKTIFSEGFMTTLAKSLLQRKKIPPNALSGFAKCNTLTFQSFLEILSGSHFAETNKNNLEIILSDTFNYDPDDIYVHVLHEKNIYEKDGPLEQSLLIKWTNETNQVWITYAMTNVRFQTTILEKLLEDPDQKNNSPLMHIIHAGDSLGKFDF